VNNQSNQIREITDAQQDIHEYLEQVVKKHFQTSFQKPIAKHTQDAFDAIKGQVQEQLNKDTPLLFDSFCGTAMSTRIIAERNPQALVLGIDRSEVRLARQNNQSLPENVILVQADCSDFWRLAVQQGWKLSKHYLLYPNPYPKTKHLKRRIHGHPAYPFLLKLGGEIELRTNWKVYAQEFHAALQYAENHDYAKPHLQLLNMDEPITLFEKKYFAAGHELFVCQYRLN